jgi:hypothetical protein
MDAADFFSTRELLLQCNGKRAGFREEASDAQKPFV